MKPTGLLRYFVVYAFRLPIAVAACTLVGNFLAIPFLTWILIGHPKWASFNMWMGGVLLGIPIGLIMAGMLTLVQWYEHSDTPLVKKIVISAVVTIFIGGSTSQMVPWINILFPH